VSISKLKAHVPLALRMFIARVREPDRILELLGARGAAGTHAYVARGVHARRWSQVVIRTGARVSRNTYFQINHFDGRKRIVLGERVFIGQSCYFSAGDCIELHNDCLIGASCSFLGAGHDYSEPTRPYAAAPIVSYGSIILGENVWVGVGATVVGDVTVGFGSVIAAGSCVREHVPPLCMVAGNPAGIIRTYDWNLRKWLKTPLQPDELREHMNRHRATLPVAEVFRAELARRVKQ
jgi:acetyltransferase-like isoleucine patch superfamily enzyme